MTVQVRFFSGIVPLVGEKSIDIAVPAGITVAGLKDRLVAEYPVLEGFMSTTCWPSARRCSRRST